MSLSLP